MIAETYFTKDITDNQKRFLIEHGCGIEPHTLIIGKGYLITVKNDRERTAWEMVRDPNEHPNRIYIVNTPYVPVIKHSVD